MLLVVAAFHVPSCGLALSGRHGQQPCDAIGLADIPALGYTGIGPAASSVEQQDLDARGVWVKLGFRSRSLAACRTRR